ncbi:citrate lyase subunit beta / citryl-CoA lyase [Halorubrum aquaticum]|uniref:Citrate lyase subunit beta / citryl-CoA lyase n=1 Tax=Halorubrum aquaticum TaxID=387340 RepID=A0A1I3BCB7_9EURY|nr:CoA ester lyase [Halorubrum aquaticum]SFH59790.1 citrate lyase subunit beta / citryl-CoA lyase [Halorubrum aquaticum]
MPRRSLLFSPGDRPELMRKGAETNADVLCFDLEDAVVPARTDRAREAVRSVLSDPAFDPDAEVCVRLTANEPEADLDALVDDGSETEGDLRLDAVMLPKVEAAASVDRADELLADRGLDPVVFAVVETAGGVLAAREIADATATTALVFGAEDLAADLGATRTAEGTEVLYAREHVVLAASAAGVDAIDTLHTDFTDEAGLREEAELAATFGYDGKLAIHPSQVDPINETFTPGADEVEWAERVLDARDAAEREGRGVFAVDGEMIDAPLVAQAERVLERAETAGLRDDDGER